MALLISAVCVVFSITCVEQTVLWIIEDRKLSQAQDELMQKQASDLRTRNERLKQEVQARKETAIDSD